MENLIASYIIQAGHCSIPSLGTFNMRHSSARNDVANKQILPPESGVDFSESQNGLSPGLVDYVVGKYDCSTDTAQEMLRNWTASECREIGEGRQCTLPLLGKLYQDEDGIIVFEENINSGIFQPVKAEQVVHTHESHAMLVGDRESNTEEMNSLLNRQEPVVKYRWWIAALMLFLVGLLLLAMYLSGSKPSQYLFGNGSTRTPAEAPDTYILK